VVALTGTQATISMPIARASASQAARAASKAFLRPIDAGPSVHDHERARRIPRRRAIALWRTRLGGKADRAHRRRPPRRRRWNGRIDEAAGVVLAARDGG
jgi:hypothetical protein